MIRSRIRVDETLLRNATNMKFIARSGAGLENIDLDYCEQRAIKCYNSPEATGMLLRNMPLECCFH